MFGRFHFRVKPSRGARTRNFELTDSFVFQERLCGHWTGLSGQDLDKAWPSLASGSFIAPKKVLQHVSFWFRSTWNNSRKAQENSRTRRELCASTASLLPVPGRFVLFRIFIFVQICWKLSKFGVIYGKYSSSWRVSRLRALLKPSKTRFSENFQLMYQKRYYE